MPAKIESEIKRLTINVLFTMGFLSAAAFGPVVGGLADRYGRKPILMIGLSLYVLFSVLAASATSFELLTAPRVGTGLGNAVPEARLKGGMDGVADGAVGIPLRGNAIDAGEPLRHELAVLLAQGWPPPAR